MSRIPLINRLIALFVLPGCGGEEQKPLECDISVGGRKIHKMLVGKPTTITVAVKSKYENLPPNLEYLVHFPDGVTLKDEYKGTASDYPGDLYEVQYKEYIWTPQNNQIGLHRFEMSIWSAQDEEAQCEMPVEVVLRDP